MSFAINIGTHATKVAKNVSGTYSQQFMDNSKKSATDAIKTASKRAFQKTTEATGDLIGNKIADKKRGASKNSLKELHWQTNLDKANN